MTKLRSCITSTAVLLFLIFIPGGVFADYAQYTGDPYNIQTLSNVSRPCCSGSGSQVYTMKIQGINYNHYSGSSDGIMAPCQNVRIAANYAYTVDKYAYRLDIYGSGGCPNPETRWEVLANSGGKIYASAIVDYFDE